VDKKIETYSTLWSLVDLDQTDHRLKEIAVLFLNAMNDWPTQDQHKIVDFDKELKEYFGSPLTIEKIDAKMFNRQNAWQVEAGCSIAALIDTSTRFCNESNFDNILKNILDFYEQEFNKTDFIAKLTYMTTEQGGRQTPAKSGYRPQVKFDFTEMQTSGQQTFIDKETVLLGDTVDAKIKILTPELFAGSLTEGMQFEFREGAKVIGIGEIKYIVNDKLEKAHR
jgi:Elongation factor Tu C-terminal domain